MAMLRSYLIRSTYDWVVDHGLTPYLLIDTEQDGVEVPDDYIEDGRIVLNAAPSAVNNWFYDNKQISFEASFGGVVWQIMLPLNAILAVYAQETSQGLYVNEEGLGLWVDEGENEADLDPTPVGEKPKKVSHLKLVK